MTSYAAVAVAGAAAGAVAIYCLGGQAKLGAKLLLDYGFTNVKTIDGGVVAYSKAFPASKPACKKPSGGG